MRLLFVIDSLGSGGAQRQMVNLALGLQQHGHQVEFFVYCPQYDFYAPILLDANIPVHKWQKKRRFDIGLIFVLRHQILKGCYDVVLSFLDAPNLYCELACRGIVRRPALVVSERNSYPLFGAALKKRLLDKFHFLADAIVVNSYYQAEQMMKYFKWMRNRLHVIYNGLDLNLYHPNNTSKKSRAFLSVGSIIPRKNVVGLARALVEYKTHYGDPPTIDWAGAHYSSSLSRVEYETTKTILRENGLEDHWTWLGERRDLISLYPLYSALIQPSFQEGLPNAVCEAMACGLPILLSNFGEHSRLVQGGTNGKLFNPYSPLEIAKAMHEFLNLDEDEQERMGAAARVFAEHEFSMDVFVNRYENLFISLGRRN